jgi:hypothetical protein
LKSVLTDADGIVVEVNEAFAHHVFPGSENLVGRPLSEFLVESDARRMDEWMKGAPLPSDWTQLSFVTTKGSPYTLRCLLSSNPKGLHVVGEPLAEGDRNATQQLLSLNNELALIARERSREKRELQRTRDRLAAALEELETSYWHLKKIQEVLPLCLSCGRVKTADATWQSVVEYLKENSLFLSHGYCPECADAFLEEMGLQEEQESP